MQALSSCPKGFHVELFAAEPELGGKPICMTWDERGRLWVCETVDYPNELQPPGEGRDRIRICEDTDGDGRADKFTVFAEKLSIPTSIAFARGGVIVHNGTRDALPQGHRRRRQGRRARACCSARWAHARHARRRRATCSTASTTGSGACRATTTRRPASAASTQRAFRQGFFRFTARTARTTRVPPLDEQQHLGPRHQRGRASSSARRPTATRASTCRSPTATTSASAAGRRS